MNLDAFNMHPVVGQANKDIDVLAMITGIRNDEENSSND